MAAVAIPGHFEVLQRPSQTVSQLVWDANGTMLACASWDGCVYLYQADKALGAFNIKLKTTLQAVGLERESLLGVAMLPVQDFLSCGFAMIVDLMPLIG